MYLTKNKNMKTIVHLFLFAFMIAGTSLTAQNVKVDTKKSTIHWLGKKITGQHDGYIQLQSGELSLKDGNITGGTFVIDMNSMTNEDLESQEYKDKLMGHLKSDDFFSVETYPTASLTITEATPFTQDIATVYGKLTIKGTTEPVKFEVKREGKTYTSKLDIDRSKFDVRYGSNSFFDNLGDKAIDDIFTLNITLATK